MLINDKFLFLEFLGVKRDGVWKKWNYFQYERDVKMAAKSLIKVYMCIVKLIKLGNIQ